MKNTRGIPGMLEFVVHRTPSPYARVQRTGCSCEWFMFVVRRGDGGTCPSFKPHNKKSNTFPFGFELVLLFGLVELNCRGIFVSPSGLLSKRRIARMQSVHHSNMTGLQLSQTAIIINTANAFCTRPFTLQGMCAESCR